MTFVKTFHESKEIVEFEHNTQMEHCTSYVIREEIRDLIERRVYTHSINGLRLFQYKFSYQTWRDLGRSRPDCSATLRLIGPVLENF